jgi:hypothetical protein
MENPADRQRSTGNGSDLDLTAGSGMPGDRQAAASLGWGIASIVLVTVGAVLVVLSESLYPRLDSESYSWLRLAGIIVGFLLGTWMSIPAVILGAVALARGTAKRKRAVTALVLGGVVFLYLFTLNAIGVYVSVTSLFHEQLHRDMTF